MVRIAHLSDIHISSPSATIARLWQGKRLLGGMNMLLFRRHELQNTRLPLLVQHLLTQDIDHVIVSGDLSTTALDAEFSQAKAELAPLWERKILTTIPGNHDIYTPQDARERRYERYFGDLHGESESANGYPFVKEVAGGIAIIGLNSCVPTGLSGAWGVIDDEQLARLPALLQRTKDRFRIVVLHHFFLDRHGRPALPRRGLRNRDALMKILSQEGCELVLHGHEHARYTYSLEGSERKIPVYNPSPSNSVSPLEHHRGGYLIYTIEDHKLQRVEGFSLSHPEGDIFSDDAIPVITPMA